MQFPSRPRCLVSRIRIHGRSIDFCPRCQQGGTASSEVG
ncbi:MAG: zinc finger domain-containing protein [Candidatus Methylomirabilales bacterium]